MQQTAVKTRRFSPRVLACGGFVVALLVLLLLPPYLNVSRFQRRIAANIGDSLGRTVHMDRVSLTLLPVPGFTLENFVVDEDPAFGYEPVIRADSVHVNVRLRSLWRHRVEFSRISLTEPHVNVVSTPDGRWNLESILLRASHIDSAPTAQQYVSAAPRFPYIEATGARINLKLGAVKLPFSLTEADFALWLPEPKVWHLRLEAHPSRTDSASPEGQLATGILRVEGTLGSAASLVEVPIDLNAAWQKAQLGGVSRLLFGRDAGIRGDLSLSASAQGTIGNAALTSSLEIAGGRRADFVPPHLLALEIGCQAIARETFHRVAEIECHLPPAGSADHSTLILTGNLPDIRHPEAAGSMLRLTAPALPSATLLDWLAVATSRSPLGILGTGTLAGDLSWNGAMETDLAPGPRTGRSAKLHAAQPAENFAVPGWSGDVTLSGETMRNPEANAEPVRLGDIILHAAQFPGQHGPEIVLLPLNVPLGGAAPATLEGHFDGTGYVLHLTGDAIVAQLLALGDSVPQLGDNLKQTLQPARQDLDSAPVAPTGEAARPAGPVTLDMTASRPWGGGQVWQEASPQPAARPRHR